MKLEQRAVTGVVWTSVDRWANRIVNFVVFAALARLLSPSEFGLVTAMMVVIEFADLYVAQGLGLAIVQRQDLLARHINAAFWTQVTSAAALAAALAAMAPYIGPRLGTEASPAVLIALVPMLLASSLSRVPVALLTRDMHFRQLAMRNLLQTIAGGTAGVSAAANGMGAWSIVIMHLVRATVGVVVLWSAIRWRPSISWSSRGFTELFQYSWKITIDQTVLFAANRLDEITVAASLGPDAMGNYSLAKRFVLLIADSTLGILNSMALPIMARLQSDPARFRTAVLTMNRLGATFVFPVLFGLAALAHTIFPAVFGDAWPEAAPIASLLAVAAIFGLAPTTVHMALHAQGKPGAPLTSNIVRATVALLALPAFAPLGALAVAWVYVARGAAGALIDLWLVRRMRHVKASEILRTCAAPAAAAGFMVPVVWVVASAAESRGPTIASGFAILSGALVYFGQLVAVSPAARSDLGRAIKGLRSRHEGKQQLE